MNRRIKEGPSADRAVANNQQEPGHHLATMGEAENESGDKPRSAKAGSATGTPHKFVGHVRDGKQQTVKKTGVSTRIMMLGPRNALQEETKHEVPSVGPPTIATTVWEPLGPLCQ